MPTHGMRLLVGERVCRSLVIIVHYNAVFCVSQPCPTSLRHAHACAMTAPCLPSCPLAPAPRSLAVFASCPPCLLYACRHVRIASCSVLSMRHAPRSLRVRSASCSSCHGMPGCQMAASRPRQPHVRSSLCSPFSPSCRRIADLRASRHANLYASRCVPPADCPIAVLPPVVASRLVVALLAVRLGASLLARRFSRCLAACARQRTVPACSPSSALMGGWRVLPSLERRLPVVPCLTPRVPVPFIMLRGNAVSAGYRL